MRYYTETNGKRYEVQRWVCPCGFSAAYNPERYFKHQDSGNCPVWPGFNPKKLVRNKLGGLKVRMP